MSTEFVILNTLEYKDRISPVVWTLDSCEQGTRKPYYMLFMEKPLHDLGIGCKVQKFNEIDLTKTWFIPMNVNQGAWDWCDLDLWSTVPEELLNELIHGNAYLIMNNENEYDTAYLFKMFYKMYYKNKRVPVKKLILFTPASEGKRLYREWVKTNNIPTEDHVQVEYCPHIDLTFGNAFEILTDFAPTRNKPKKYTCLNRAFRAHRPVLVSLLTEAGVLDQGYVSLGMSKHEKDKITVEFESVRNYLRYQAINLPGMELHNEKNAPTKDRLLAGIELIHDKIPICVDKTEFETNYADWMSTPVDNLRDSYFSIVTSTHFFGWQEKSPGWNEKEWKPMLCRQPFIIVNRPHILKQMRRFGFLTFSRWINESYDDMEDDWDRMNAIANEIVRLSKLSNQEWDRMLDEMQHILDYNRRVIIEKRWDNIFYSSDLKNLLTYI